MLLSVGWLDSFFLLVKPYNHMSSIMITLIKSILPAMLWLVKRKTGNLIIAYWTKIYPNSVQNVLKFILGLLGTHSSANLCYYYFDFSSGRT